MTSDELVAALALPAGTAVNQKVPKKHLLEEGAPTAADKRAITDGIDEIRWLAALKPHTIGVPEHRGADRDYTEIHVLRLALRPGAKTARLVELLHRAIPYPLLLVHEAEEAVGVSAAHKRKSLGEADRIVLEESPLLVEPFLPALLPHREAFLAALPLGKQPQGSLLSLYTGWLDTLLALETAARTGRFTITATPAETQARRDALRCCAVLEAEMAAIRAAAAHERQVARQVELNLKLKRVRADFDLAMQSLITPEV
jgi:hypothetical protein